jgi:putative transposase
MTKFSPFRYFKTSPEVIRLAVMLYVRFPLPLRNVQDLLHERGVDISNETVRFWWNGFQESLGQTNRRLPVPYFQWDAMAGYPACYAVLSPDQCR